MTMTKSSLHVVRSDNIIYFDVDETLVLWDVDTYSVFKGDDDIIRISDPYLEEGCYTTVIPHKRNIDLLKRNHGQGRTIVVWSAAGYAWAENVVKALDLEKYVSLIIAKPSVYVDDKPMEDWKLNRIYLSKNLPKAL